MKLLALVIGMMLVELSAAVQITVTSQCSFPIWIGTAGNPALSGGIPRLNPGASVTFPIPSTWISGRMWPKIGCDGSGNNCQFGQSVDPCPSGGCQPAANTLVEFTISNGQADYDISFVDGYSLPVQIVPSKQGGSCSTTVCNIAVSACPQNEIDGLGDLRVIEDGHVVACLSPCNKWTFPAPYGQGKPITESPGVYMCCPKPISPKQCNQGGVKKTQYVNLVQKSCPSAYSFSYDDIDGHHKCTGSTNFAVTFCPSAEPISTCTLGGWKFYDNYDIQGNDIGHTYATDPNDCQPLCRSKPGCKAYSWAARDKNCFFKSGASVFLPSERQYSAVIC
jgi:hypothetical protein